jgi:hypothetical protein
MGWPKGPTQWIDGRTLHISVPFTWDLPKVRACVETPSFLHDRVRVGGPAVDLMPGFFDGLDHVEAGGRIDGVLQRVNPEATRTTYGCTNACKFCAVPKIEGKFVELADWPDRPMLCDNNLLASSMRHFHRVMDRLDRHAYSDANQGLDARLLNDEHAERIGRNKGFIARLALDSDGLRDQWQNAYDLLRKHGTAKRRIRTYALVGWHDTPDDAWGRCEWIESHKVKALPMWHHALNQLHRNIVRPDQAERGWTDYERRRIMQWYYKHKEAVAR